jgi:hypothetical protein
MWQLVSSFYQWGRNVMTGGKMETKREGVLKVSNFLTLKIGIF